MPKIIPTAQEIAYPRKLGETGPKVLTKTKTPRPARIAGTFPSPAAFLLDERPVSAPFIRPVRLVHPSGTCAPRISASRDQGE